VALLLDDPHGVPDGGPADEDGEDVSLLVPHVKGASSGSGLWSGVVIPRRAGVGWGCVRPVLLERAVSVVGSCRSVSVSGSES